MGCFGSIAGRHACAEQTRQVVPAMCATLAHPMSRPPERAEFAETQWSVISAARGDTPGALEAMETLARSYTAPLRAYVSALCGPNDAEDLVQEFFARKMLREPFLDSVRRGTGSFRTYLKLCVRRFVIDQRDPNRRRRPPGEAAGDLRLNDPGSAGCQELNLVAQEPAADVAMDRAWLQQLLARARARLEAECVQAGKSAVFAEFIRVLEHDPEARTYREIGRLTGLSEVAVKTTFWRFRERLKALLNEEIRQTVAHREDWEQERALLLRLWQDPAPAGSP